MKGACIRSRHEQGDRASGRSQRGEDCYSMHRSRQPPHTGEPSDWGSTESETLIAEAHCSRSCMHMARVMRFVTVLLHLHA
jgi:hypothetical protein